MPLPARGRASARATTSLSALAAAALLLGAASGAASAQTVDTTPPSVAFQAPAPGATVSGAYRDDRRISVTATDDVRISHVDFSVDGTLVNREKTAPYTGNWDTTTVPDGRHTITATAVDTAGNARSASVEVVVANGPVVTWKSPTEGQTVSGNLDGGTACEVAASSRAGVRTVDFFVDDGPLNTERTAPYTCYFDTRTVSDGPHRIEARVVDGAGKTASSSVTVTVRNGTVTPPPPPPGPTPPPTDPVIAAVGDIACSPDDPDFNGGKGTSTRCRQMATSDLVVGKGLAKVLLLGDEQYDSGTLSAFRASYDPSWGRVKDISAPIPGNHEYRTSGGAGYYDYFGALAGPRGKGYYSYDVGTWHLVGLNSNIDRDSGSEQIAWLKRDLAANAAKKCTIAYWHHPRFSAGNYGSNTTVQPFWQAAYDAGVDVVLTGHDHGYQRFAPLDASGKKDATRGIRSFVSGAGGRNHYPLKSSSLRDAGNGDTFGVLMMTLRDGAYDWRFQPEAGKTYADRGTGTCH